MHTDDDFLVRRLKVYPGPESGFDGGGFPIEEPVGSEFVKVFLTPVPLRAFGKALEEATQLKDSGAAGADMMRGMSRSLDRASCDGLPRAIGVKKESPGNAPDGVVNPLSESFIAPGRIDWSAFSGTNWAESTLLFTTSY